MFFDFCVRLDTSAGAEVLAPAFVVLDASDFGGDAVEGAFEVPECFGYLKDVLVDVVEVLGDRFERQYGAFESEIPHFLFGVAFRCHAGFFWDAHLAPLFEVFDVLFPDGDFCLCGRERALLACELGEGALVCGLDLCGAEVATGAA